MSQRSKNLLEAFNQSKAPEKSVQPVTPPRGSTPRVGGPFADSAAPNPQAEAPRPSEVRQRSDSVRALSSRWRLVLLAGLIAVTFFLLGRASAPSVQAAGDSLEGAAPGQPVAAAPAPLPEAAGLTVEQRLFDPANKFTVLAITYKRSEANKELAKVAWNRLLELGLPAAKPYENAAKNEYTILVGAARKAADLDALVARVVVATTANGRTDFKGARAVPIDNYIDRK